jgi:hypothetical protein
LRTLAALESLIEQGDKTMRKNIRNTACVSGTIVILLLAWISLGCGTSAPPQPTAPKPGTEAPLMDATEHQHTTEDQGEEVRAALAGLSPDDRESAQRQRICPVSGEMLGSMGEPIKLEVEGREVWICCAGCEAPLRKDPERHFAKLNDG